VEVGGYDAQGRQNGKLMRNRNSAIQAVTNPSIGALD
jgi:hypothetical protein